MTKLNIIKIIYDVISVTSLLLRHQYNVTKFFQFASPTNQDFCLRQCFLYYFKTNCKNLQ